MSFRLVPKSVTLVVILRYTERKKIAKNLQSRHHRTTYSGYILVLLRHVSTIGKKLVKQHYLPHMSSQYAELRPTSG